MGKKAKDAAKSATGDRGSTGSGADVKLARSTEPCAAQAGGLLDALDAGKRRAMLDSEFWQLQTVRAILEGRPDLQAAVVVEAVRRIGALRARIDPEIQQAQLMNLDMVAGYPTNAVTLLGTLLKRKLPLTDDNWAQILQELARFELVTACNMSFLPALVSALEKRAAERPLSQAAQASLASLAAATMAWGRAEDTRLARRMAALVTNTGASQPVQRPTTISRASAQERGVPEGFRAFGMLSQQYIPPAEAGGQTRCSFRLEHLPCDRELAELLNDVLRYDPGRRPDQKAWEACRQKILGQASGRQIGVLRLLAGAMTVLSANRERGIGEPNWDAYNRACEAVLTMIGEVCDSLARQSSGLVQDDVLDIAASLCELRSFEYYRWPGGAILNLIAVHWGTLGLNTEGERGIAQIRERVARDTALPIRYVVGDFDRAIGRRVDLPLLAGDRFADSIVGCVRKQPERQRAAWKALLTHAATASGARPTAKWQTSAEKALDAVGREAFRQMIIESLPLFGKPRESHGVQSHAGRDGSVPAEANADVLKGLVWLCARFDEPKVCALVGDVQLASFKMIAGVGARCVKVGNACVWTLSQISGAGAASQLSRSRQLVKFGSARNALDKALNAAAEKAGCSRQELEETSVPTFGLDNEGKTRKRLSGITAEIAIRPSGDVDLTWIDAKGKVLKSVPAKAKKEHQETVRGLKQTLADIRKLLPAQRDRIEQMLLSGRALKLRDWRQRYLDHPLVAGIARRLIWHFASGRNKGQAIWHRGRLVNASDKELGWLTDDTQVQLWHPIGFAPEQVMAWRDWLVKHEVTQPFKQAFREVYVLTDAELETRTYSNRFAAHIIKVPQLTRLAQARGWSGGTVGNYDPVDASYPSIKLPQYGLRVEFWVTGAGEETTNAGIHLFGQTDQVRFYRMDEQDPLPLDEVPAIVFTEVMRDVDLFVGVTSIGNDPTWHDRGEGHAYDEYWRHFSFGELTESAKVRRDVLARILPRLAIGPKCSLGDRYLVVRGNLRTYKIHLGSGNILMEPNDQYLCIVPEMSRRAAWRGLFLPFDGDATLSIILSKALLLADDANIKDETITRQIIRKGV